jgi:hypothetical protein
LARNWEAAATYSNSPFVALHSKRRRGRTNLDRKHGGHAMIKRTLIPFRVLLSTVSILACAMPRSSETASAAAAHACTVPTIPTTGWRSAELTFAPVRLLFPVDLPEKVYRFREEMRVDSVAARHRPLGSTSWIAPDRSLSVGVTAFREPLGRVATDASMRDLTHCTATISGRPVQIDSYRIPTRDQEEGAPPPPSRYMVSAVVEVDANTFLHFTAGGSSRGEQERALAILRSIRIVEP